VIASLLALAAAASWGTGDFLGGLSTRTAPIIVVLFVSQSAGTVFTLVVVLAAGHPLPGTTTLLYGVAAGLSGMVGLAALYTGLSVGRMGIVAPIASMSGVVPVLVGFLRGERPAAVQIAGMVLALIGVMFAARAEEQEAEAEGKRLATGVGYALAAAATLGFTLVFLDIAGRRDEYWSVFSMRIGALAVLGVAVAVTRPSFRMKARSAGTLVAVGLFDNGANLLFVLAAVRGLLTLVSVLGSLYPVSTVLLARTFLHERMRRSQAFGVAAALIGVALIASG
jgi:drug/metabolite transporter (DMT)-like permease